MAKKMDYRIDIQNLLKAVISANEDAINSFPVSVLSPLPGNINKISQGSLVFRHDLECGTRRQPCEFDGNNVNSPNDLFYKEGKLAERIFLLGEAGYGKTTFCLQLLSQWCKVKKSESVLQKVHRFFGKNEKSDHYHKWWEDFVGKFDLALYVSLSHVGSDYISLKDMCCRSMLGKKLRQKQSLSETLKLALQDVNFSCLIMIDGLDDWLFYPDLSMDDMYGNLLDESYMPNCTVLITSSPSKFEALTKLITPSDKVVELEGLDSSGTKSIFINTLLEILGKESSKLYNKSYSSLVELLKIPIYSELLKAPVFASVMAHVIHQKKDFDHTCNWTELYCFIVDSLILRAKNDKKVKFNHDDSKTSDVSQEQEGFISVRLSKLQTLTSVMADIVLLGRAAYDGLMSNPPQIKFEAHDLFDNVGDAIDFGVVTGLLLETCPPSKAHCSLQIYHFLHKSIQEMLAAIFVSYLKKDKVSHLLGKCNTVDKILEQSNLLVFLMGLTPDVGAVLSKHIMELANSDADMQTYRQTFQTDKETKVEALFKLLTRGYRECLTAPMEPQSYHATDAYLTFTSHYYHLPEDIDLARLTFDLLTHHHQSLLSLCLKGVPDDPAKGISNTELTQLLDKIVTLKSLCIFNMTLTTISTRFTSLSTLSLWYITLSVEGKGQLENALSLNSQLKNLELGAFFGMHKTNFCLNLKSCNELSHLSFISMEVEKLDVPKQKMDSVVLKHVKGPAIPEFLASLNQFHMLRILCIDYLPEAVSRETFLEILPTLSSLHRLVYHGSLSSERVRRDDSSDTEYDSNVVTRALTLSQLRRIEFGNIDLSECGLSIPTSMTELEVLQLGSLTSRMKMSNQGWKDLVTNFMEGCLSYELHLYDTDIDDKTYQSLCIASRLQLEYCQGKFGVKIKKLKV